MYYNKTCKSLPFDGFAQSLSLLVERIHNPVNSVDMNTVFNNLLNTPKLQKPIHKYILYYCLSEPTKKGVI